MGAGHLSRFSPIFPRGVGMKRLAAFGATAVGVVPLVVVGASPAWACVGSSLCSPEAAVILAETAGPASSVVVPAGFVGTVETATIATAVKSVSVGSTAVAAGVLTTGVALTTGGLGPWTWNAPAESALPAPSLGDWSVYVPAGFAGGGVSGTVTDVFSDGYHWSTIATVITAASPGVKQVKRYCRAASSPLLSAQALYEAELGIGGSSLSSAGYSSAMGGNAYSSTTAVTSVSDSLNRCSTASTAPLYYFGGYFGLSSSGVRFAAVPPVAPGSAVSAALEQTVTCKRADGTTYTADAAVPLTMGSPNAIAALSCDAGDVALDSSADIQRTYGDGSTRTDAVITPAADGNALTDPATATGFGAQISSDPVSFADAPVVYVNNPGTTAVPIGAPGVTVTATPAVDSPASSTGEDFCGFSFGSLLDGTVVYRAVSCALSWAFVPSSGFMEAKVQAARSAWSSSSVGTLVTEAATIPLALGSLGSVDGGCAGPTFTVPIVDPPVTVQPLNACHEPMATVARWVRLLTTIMLVVLGVLFVLRPVLSGLGVPSLRGGSADGD